MKKLIIGMVITISLVLVGCQSETDTSTTETSNNATETTSELSYLDSNQKEALSDFSKEYESILVSIDNNDDVDTSKLIQAYEKDGNPDESSEFVTFEEALNNPDSTFSAVSLSKDNEQSEANKRAFLDTVESYLQKKVESFDLDDSQKQEAFYQTISQVKYPDSFKASYDSLSRLRPTE